MTLELRVRRIARMSFSHSAISRAFVSILVVAIVTALGCREQLAVESAAPAAKTQLEQYPHFVFVKITDPITPIERGTKYENPLVALLQTRKLGEITGGGTQLDENNKIAWVGIDLQLADLEGAVDVVQQKLRELGAAAGSQLEFTRGDRKVTVPIN